MKLISLMMLFAGITLGACSAPKKNQLANEAGPAAIRGKWLVMKISIDSTWQEVAALDMFVDFDPDSGRVIGKGTCNRFFGNLKLTENQLMIGPLVGTLMACEGMDSETKLLRLFEHADHFTEDGERLLIQTGGKTMLELIPYPVHNQMLDEGMAETNIPLDMYDWKFVEMIEADSTVPVSQVNANIRFDPLNQKFSGFAGCNRFFGSATLQSQFNAGSIALGNIGSTRMACPQLATEGKILSGLQRITRYEIRNKSLLLFDHDRQVFQLNATPRQQ